MNFKSKSFGSRVPRRTFLLETFLLEFIIEGLSSLLHRRREISLKYCVFT
jgi:hypothetical protein